MGNNSKVYYISLKFILMVFSQFQPPTECFRNSCRSPRHSSDPHLQQVWRNLLRQRGAALLRMCHSSARWWRRSSTRCRKRCSAWLLLLGNDSAGRLRWRKRCLGGARCLGRRRGWCWRGWRWCLCWHRCWFLGFQMFSLLFALELENSVANLMSDDLGVAFESESGVHLDRYVKKKGLQLTYHLPLTPL